MDERSRSSAGSGKAWMRLRSQVKEDTLEFHVPAGITSREALEEYAQYVMDFTVSLSQKHGKIQCLGPRCHSWWSPEVADAISKYRQALRGRRSPGVMLQARIQRKSIIRRSKAASFRGFMHSVANQPKALWKMARWGRTSSHTPPVPPVVPPLRTPAPFGSNVNSLSGKANLLRGQFFPEPDPADLSDIPCSPSRDEGPCLEITQDEVAQIIHQLPHQKAPGISGVPNLFLKAMGSQLAAVLTLITQAARRVCNGSITRAYLKPPAR